MSKFIFFLVLFAIKISFQIHDQQQKHQFKKYN